MDAGLAFGSMCSGNLSSDSVNKYTESVNNNINMFSSFGGWFKEAAIAAKNKLDNFLNSNMWEFGKRFESRNLDKYIGPFDIGYLNTLDKQLESTGFMKNYIYANPDMYDYCKSNEEFDKRFKARDYGRKDKNPFYRAATDGLIIKEDDKFVINDYLNLSNKKLDFTDQVSIQRTWDATNEFIARKLFK